MFGVVYYQNIIAVVECVWFDWRIFNENKRCSDNPHQNDFHSLDVEMLNHWWKYPPYAYNITVKCNSALEHRNIEIYLAEIFCAHIWLDVFWGYQHMFCEMTFGKFTTSNLQFEHSPNNNMQTRWMYIIIFLSLFQMWIQCKSLTQSTLFSSSSR